MAGRRRALVTGGAGFLGSHLCEHLLHQGYSVVCIDNFSTGTPTNLKHLDEVGPFTLIHGDVTEMRSLGAGVADVDAVLHFASPASPMAYQSMPIATLKAGSLGTLNTLDIAYRNEARYLLASTSEVYGNPQVHPQTETYFGNVDPTGPRSCYDEAKRFSEAATVAYHAKGAKTAIARLFNTYGPRMRPDDGRVVPTFIRQALLGEAITVSGDGRQTRSIQYVDDCIDGCLRLLHSEHRGPINIGSTYEISILDLAILIRDIAGSSSSIVHIPRPAHDPNVRRPDIALAGRLLNWAPLVDVEQGLTKTVEWFEDLLRG